MKYRLSILLLLTLLIGFVASCKKDDPPTPITEPMTFVTPDTNRIRAQPLEVINLELQLTTDRIIDTLRGGFHIDTTNSNFDAAVDPTTSFLTTGFGPDSNNIETWTGTYTLPHDTIVGNGDVIRLLFTMEARNNLTYQKILRIDVR